MDSDKLIAKYRILKFFIDVVDISLSLLIAILVYGIPTMIFIALVHLTNLLNPILVILVLYLFILVFFYDMYDSKIRSFIEYLSISDRLFNHYMTKWNTSEDQIKYLIKEKKAEAKRKKYMEPERRLLRNEKDIAKPLIYQLCMLNQGGIEEQKGFLKDIYDEDTIKNIVSFGSYCIEPHLNSVYKKWRLKDISERRKLVNFLFKLAIVQDGIHLDEWNFLIKLMGEFRFSQALISFYINRYSALRTEFEESEWEDNESSSTTGRNSNVDLNPYYAILGLDNSASVKEIKKAYHALALQFHPDLSKNANRIKECEEMMAKINEAYEKIIK